MNQNVFNFMGVINITPDSFSDGGENNSPEQVLKSVKKHLAHGANALDFGAESTAPANKAISVEVELGRFEEFFFPVIKEVLASKVTLSIDTYKPEVMNAVASKVYQYDPNADLIWNDVSGALDVAALRLLKKYPDLSYVLCHNLAPSRELTSSHIDYVQEVLDLETYFKAGLVTLSFHKKVILDPCFGFSKSYEQNWELIKKLPALVNSFQCPWLLGISRKSFLKRALKQSGLPEGFSYREILQSDVLNKWSQSLPQGHYFIRIHDVASGQTALLGQQLLT